MNKIDKMKRMEEMADAFLDASVENKNLALSIMTNAEKEAFMLYVGFYRLMTDEKFYAEVRDRLSIEIYKEANK